MVADRSMPTSANTNRQARLKALSLCPDHAAVTLCSTTNNSNQTGRQTGKWASRQGARVEKGPEGGLMEHPHTTQAQLNKHASAEPYNSSNA
jgi:hypothetical protein